VRRRGLLGAAGLALLPRVASAADEVDVAILGGGLAGLTAGRALMAANRKVLVLEARDRIGGRTVTDSSLGFPIDLGAAWLAPGALAKELGGKLLPGPDVGAMAMGGKPLTAAQNEAYAKSADRIAVMLKEMHSTFPAIPNPDQYIHPATPDDQLALFRLTNKPPFAPTQALEGGIGAAVARFGAKVPVRLGTRVLRIDSTGPRIEVVTPAGTLQARAVVVALPASVLAGGHMGFSPPLSQKKRDALAASPMAPCIRIALSFQPGLPKTPANAWVTGLTKAGLPFDALLRPQNRDAAIVVLEGYAARQIEESGANASGAFALNTLAEIYGADVRAAFRGSVASHWGRDPLALGAWCVAAPGAAAVLAAPHNERVFFAGEATAENAGTIEAAYASGLRAAAEVKAMLR
jgi:monoamine oxidase